jgi:hypothetical protein
MAQIETHHMRFNPYDDTMVQPITTSSVAIQSFSGSSAVDSDSVDTAQTWPVESAMIHVRAEIASGSPSAATLAWALQESTDNSTWVAANDNTGTAIGATLNVHTVAQDSYARIEGINLQNTSLTAAPYGGRRRYLRVVFTPAFTSGSSPAILGYAEFIGTPASGQPLPVRTTVSNT